MLEILAKRRIAAIYAALQEDRDLPAHWVADARAAYDILLGHPGATVNQILDYGKFLGVIQAWREEFEVAQHGLERYPMSSELNDRFRSLCLAHEGASHWPQHESAPY